MNTGKNKPAKASPSVQLSNLSKECLRAVSSLENLIRDYEAMKTADDLTLKDAIRVVDRTADRLQQVLEQIRQGKPGEEVTERKEDVPTDPVPDEPPQTANGT